MPTIHCCQEQGVLLLLAKSLEWKLTYESGPGKRQKHEFFMVLATGLLHNNHWFLIEEGGGGLGEILGWQLNWFPNPTESCSAVNI